MKVIVEYEIEPSADNPEAELDAERVTLVLRRRITNSDATVYSDYYVGRDGKIVRFWAEVKNYSAIERVE